MEQQKYAVKKVRRRVAAIILVVIFAVGGGGLIVNGFKIRKIEMENYAGDIVFNREKITDNLLFFPALRAREEILRANKEIEEVTIEKKFPQTLVFRIIRRKAVAQVISGGGSYLVDKTGVVISESGGDNSTIVIKLESGEKLPIGVKLAKSAGLSAVNLAVSLEEKNLPEMSLVVQMEKITGIYEAGEILFPIVDDYASTASTLQSLWSGFRIKGNIPRLIDLRYRQPVVNF